MQTFILYLIVQGSAMSGSVIGQAAFHVGRPKYVWRELGKIPWRTKECCPCLGLLVTENPLDGSRLESLFSAHGRNFVRSDLRA